MIYIETEKTQDGRDRVSFIHYMPDMLSQEEQQKGILLDLQEPPVENHPDKVPVLYFNYDNQAFYYEYVDRPLEPLEKIDVLERENANMKNQITTMQETINFLLGI